MLNKILLRNDVSKLYNEIVENERYSNKKNDDFSVCCELSNKEQALILLYEGLFKYEVIVAEEMFLSEFVDQIDKLFKKIDNFNDINLGINKLIVKFVAKKLNIKEIEENNNQDIILKYIYDKYIINGFYFHGYSSYYSENIKKMGFDPENYQNYYSEFLKLNEIFNKYGINNILAKDFFTKESYLTDSFLMGCYYSINAPMYFSNLLAKNEYSYLKYKKDAYLKDDYDGCIKNLKKLFLILNISEEDKKEILEIVKKEWDLLHLCEKKISVLLIKREKVLNHNNINLDNIINDKTLTFYDKVNYVMTPRNDKIVLRNKVNIEDVFLLEFSLVKKEIPKKQLEDEEKLLNREMLLREFKNVYGKATTFLIIGALLVSLGVIITIIMVLRG